MSSGKKAIKKSQQNDAKRSKASAITRGKRTRHDRKTANSRRR